MCLVFCARRRRLAGGEAGAVLTAAHKKRGDDDRAKERTPSGLRPRVDDGRAFYVPGCTRTIGGEEDAPHDDRLRAAIISRVVGNPGIGEARLLGLFTAYPACHLLGLFHALAADGLLRVSSMRRATPGEAAIFPTPADAVPDGEGSGRPLRHFFPAPSAYTLAWVGERGQDAAELAHADGAQGEGGQRRKRGGDGGRSDGEDEAGGGAAAGYSGSAAAKRARGADADDAARAAAGSRPAQPEKRLQVRLGRRREPARE